MKGDPKDPVSSKGLPGANLASVIALKRGLRTKRRLAAPRDRSVLPCRVCSGAGRSVPAKHGSITFTDAPCRPSYALAGTATLEVLWK